MGPKEIIELQTWWLGELKVITERVIREEEKRQARVKKKSFAELDEYRNIGDILDAYGMGCITERKKDKLMDLWEKRDVMEWDDPFYQRKRNLLMEFYRLAREIVEEERKVLDKEANSKAGR